MSANFLGYYINLGVGILTPILVTPTLIQRLGISEWGKFAVLQTVGAILTMFIDYNFSLSGNRDIARASKSSRKTSLVVSRIFTFQLYSAILTISASLAAAIMFEWSPFDIIFVVSIMIFQGISPNWYYQGKERYQVYSTIDACFKAMYVMCVIFLIKQNGDIGLWRTIFVSSLAGPSLILWLIIIRENKINILHPGKYISIIMLYRQEFILRFLSVSYMQANGPIISIVAGPSAAGIYIALERLMRSVIYGLSPILQARYPEIARLVKVDPYKAREIVLRGSFGILSVMMVISTALIIFSSEFLKKYLHTDTTEVRTAFYLMCAFPIFAILNGAMSTRWLIPLNLTYITNYAVMISGIIGVSICWMLSSYIGVVGGAASLFFTEAIIFGILFATTLSKGINPFFKNMNLSYLKEGKS